MGNPDDHPSDQMKSSSDILHQQPEAIRLLKRYLSLLCLGVTPATVILVINDIIQLFPYNVGYKTRLLVSSLLVVNWPIRLLPHCGLEAILVDIETWTQHDAPDPPSVVSISSILQALAFLFPTLYVSFDISLAWKPIQPFLLPFIISSPSYIFFICLQYEITGVGKPVNKFLSWLRWSSIEVGPLKFQMTRERLITIYELLWWLGLYLEVYENSFLCKVISTFWPNTELTCSRVPVIFLFSALSIVILPFYIRWQALKIIYWNCLAISRKAAVAQCFSNRLDRELFAYEPLDVGFIRVLDVLSEDITEPGDIRVRLRSVRLEEASYDAISYTWGHPAKTRGIVIGNKWLPVTENAFEVLGDRISRLGSTRTLWIDCICINQEDDDEKARQVCLMSEIYKRANRTIVWLGQLPDAIRAFSLMRDLARRVPMALEHNETAQHRWLGLSESIRVWFFRKTDMRDPRFDALCRLLSHPYFRRAWVVQELVFSRTIHIRCGSCWLNWSVLANAVGALNSGEDARLVGADIVMSKLSDYGILQHILVIVSLKLGLERTNNPLPLSSLVIKLSATQASDERDKIFGILSMSQEAHEPTLTPNYTITISELLQRVANYFLKKSEFQEVLYFAGIGYGTSSPNLPSWLPDLSARPAVLPLRRHDTGVYDASGGRILELHQHASEEAISMTGVAYDRITKIVRNPFPSGGFFDVRRAAQFFEGVFAQLDAVDLASSLPTEYKFPSGNTQTRTEAFRRTRIGDKCVQFQWLQYGAWEFDKHGLQVVPNMYTRPAPLEKWHESLACLDFINLAIKDLGDIREKLCKPRSQFDHHLAEMLFKTILKMSSMKALAPIYHDRGYADGAETAAGRKFAVTERGLMALIPPNSQIGDEVCVLFGMEVPFILRRASGFQEEAYHLVGESYVHGIMDGEAFTDGNLPKEFLIR
jgi:hypothetical protein